MTVDIAIEGCARTAGLENCQIAAVAPKLRWCLPPNHSSLLGVGLFIVRLLLAAVCLWQAAGTAVLKSRRAPTVGRRRADRPDEWARGAPLSR